MPDTTIPGPVMAGGAGRCVAGAGDVNGDGIGDFLVGSPYVGGGAVHLYTGSPGVSPDASADATLSGITMGSQFGLSAAGAGDVNGDGFLDIVVGAPSFPGAVFVFLGGSGPFGSVPAAALTGPTDLAFGQAVY